VIALARPENAASIAVMRKLGMRFENRIRAFGLEAVRYAAHAAPPGGGGACTSC
jgi:RimJ/RimL family protein N-acetyltransferase